jgi:hypothetical protein
MQIEGKNRRGQPTNQQNYILVPVLSAKNSLNTMMIMMMIIIIIIPGKHSIDSLQKTDVLGTSHIIRKVLQSET